MFPATPPHLGRAQPRGRSFTLPDAVDLSWLSRPLAWRWFASFRGLHLSPLRSAAHPRIMPQPRLDGTAKPPAGSEVHRSPAPAGEQGDAASPRRLAGQRRGALAPADLLRATMLRGGRSTPSPNPAALPASMGPTPEGRRRVIGTQLEAGSACALAVASQGRLRACALAQGAALASKQLASKQVASKQVACAAGPWAVRGAVHGAVRAWAGRGWADDAWSRCAWTGCAWTGCVQSSRQAARADQQLAYRQPWGMPTGDPGRRFLPGPNSFSRTACASRALCTSDFGPKL
jgi:hypothetical protein